MARIDSAYDYYISTYAQKKVSRYDSHKKSDLRKVYNQIVKSNKDSPLYKIPNMEANGMQSTSRKVQSRFRMLLHPCPTGMALLRILSRKK